MGDVSRGEDGALEPRLRLGGVVVRGAAYGVGAAVCVVVAAFVFQVVASAANGSWLWGV